VEETFDVVEDIDKLVSASTRIFGRLTTLDVKIGRTREMQTPTERRTPIPAKITVAGGND